METKKTIWKWVVNLTEEEPETGVEAVAEGPEVEAEEELETEAEEELEPGMRVVDNYPIVAVWSSSPQTPRSRQNLSVFLRSDRRTIWIDLDRTPTHLGTFFPLDFAEGLYHWYPIHLYLG